jgi:hypothetical protein
VSEVHRSFNTQLTVALHCVARSGDVQLRQTLPRVAAAAAAAVVSCALTRQSYLRCFASLRVLEPTFDDIAWNISLRYGM